MPLRALTGIAKPILDNARSNPSCFETIQIWPINITRYGYGAIGEGAVDQNDSLDGRVCRG